jgi:bile acid:Na+ symporter, BASS family
MGWAGFGKGGTGRMDGHEGLLDKLSHFVHQRLLWLMIGSYAVAAFAPSFGLWMRDVAVGELSVCGSNTRMSLSMLMLAALLLNAGLGVTFEKVRQMFRSPTLLGAGLLANLLMPIAFILVITRVMAGWHNADEVQNILVGLALVASMPIAGSSTAWAQNADGELTLSLGMVLLSTLLSPMTTPIALHSVGLMATGDYSEDLHELAAGGTGMFLAICVLAPSLIGICVRQVVGDARYAAARPRLKLINSVILLVLNYSNASVSLPQAVANPDPDFLAVTLGIVVALCVLAFAAGWMVSWFLGATPAQRISLMFGLGMNNNGTGLVLASMALADHPRVMLPIIFYNLVQHLIAGIVDRMTCRTSTSAELPLRTDRHGRVNMRKQIVMGVLTVLGFSVLMGAAKADEEKIPIDKLPAAVLKAVKRKFPKAEIEKATREVEDGTTTYEVELEIKDRSVDVALKADGTILEIEREVPIDELPKAVKKKLAARYPNAKIEKAEEVTKGEDGPVRYEVAIRTEVVLTAKGKIIQAKEKEDEEPSGKSRKQKSGKDDDDDDDDDD